MSRVRELFLEYAGSLSFSHCFEGFDEEVLSEIGEQVSLRQFDISDRTKDRVSVIVQVAVYKRTGKRVFRMAPIHHHFEQLGWKESTVVIRFWIVAVVLALSMGFAALNGGQRITLRLGLGTIYRVPVTAVAFGSLILGAAVMGWVTGFDILYACQDADFDRAWRLFNSDREDEI